MYFLRLYLHVMTYECCLVEFSRYGGIVLKDSHFICDDRLDGFNCFGCHVPGPEIGVGWQPGNSLSVGTNVGVDRLQVLN